MPCERDASFDREDGFVGGEEASGEGAEERAGGRGGSAGAGDGATEESCGHGWWWIGERSGELGFGVGGREMGNGQMEASEEKGRSRLEGGVKRRRIFCFLEL